MSKLTSNGPWNPRYVRYAALQGRTPGAQLDHDKSSSPGGCLLGFSRWIAACKVAYLTAKGVTVTVHSQIDDQDAWDAFLNSDAAVIPEAT